jgi:hypothetical protein
MMLMEVGDFRFEIFIILTFVGKGHSLGELPQQKCIQAYHRELRRF